MGAAFQNNGPLTFGASTVVISVVNDVFWCSERPEVLPGLKNEKQKWTELFLEPVNGDGKLFAHARPVTERL